jgi:transposase-like protein
MRQKQLINYGIENNHRPLKMTKQQQQQQQQQVYL